MVPFFFDYPFCNRMMDHLLLERFRPVAAPAAKATPNEIRAETAETAERKSLFLSAVSARLFLFAVKEAVSADSCHILHRHPELVSGSMACRFLRRSAKFELAPWMLKQVQHDENGKAASHPQSRHPRLRLHSA